jgi:arylsulfatase A-like enzyme
LILLAGVVWVARDRLTSLPAPPRFHVVERLTTPAGAPLLTPAAAAVRARLRWSAADIARTWTRVTSGASATLRSPRLELGTAFHSIVIVRPPSRTPVGAPMLLWSATPQLEGAAFARNRRELPVAQEAATLVLGAEVLQSDERQPIQYLFLHLPQGMAIDHAVESIAILTTPDLAAASVGLSRIATDGETRNAFASSAPLSFRVSVPANAQLAFGIRAGASSPGTRVRVTQTIGNSARVQFESAVSAGRWIDLRAPLQDAAESTVTLSLTGARNSVTYWSEPLLLAPEQAEDRPSVVLVVVDALRADALAHYGAAESAMPFLDRLASRSIVYGHAYAATSWTKPSIATLLTSLYPWTHALGARYYADELPRDVLTLQSVLSAYGYTTAQFSANPFTGAASGLDRGFDTALMAPALGQQSAFAVKATDVVERFLYWRRQGPADRYFAYLHLVDVHGAKDPASYRAAARGVDGQLERLHDQLNMLPGAGNTLLVVTADHGEAFGDHGQAGHGQSVYEEETRVPLIIHEPRQTDGVIVDEPVHSIDLMPTLLDYARITIDRAMIQGRSLHDRDRDLQPSPVVVTKFTYPNDMATRGDGAEMHAFVDAPWKLIVIDRRGQPRVYELYRLDTDASERTNLASAEAERVRRMERTLDTFLREQAKARARFASMHETGVARSPVPARELVDQLRSLGYLR